MLLDAPSAVSDASWTPRPAGPKGTGRKYHHLRNQRIESDSGRARELIAQYGRLVMKIVSEERRQLPRRQAMMDRDDMVAIGHAMMIQAVESYSDQRGMKVSSWVAFKVRQGITSVVSELHGTMTARGSMKSYSKGAKDARPVHVSVDEPLAGTEDLTLLDTLAHDAAPADEELAKRLWLERALEWLDERERECIVRVMEGTSTSTIGASWGVSRQRADQIYQGAVEKLRKRWAMETRTRVRVSFSFA